MNNQDELVLFGVQLDQPIPDGEDDFWADRIDEILEKAFQDKDADYALNACESLVKIAKLSGKFLAILLYKLKAHWEIFETLDVFEDVIYPRIGFHKHTIDRYIRVGEMLETGVIPSEYQEQIEQRNLNELFPIANALAQGHTLDNDDWKKIANAPDATTIGKEMRDVKGQEPRKSGLMIMMDAHGTLWAYQENNRYFIGSLEIKDTEPVIQKAVTRILERSGVMKQ